jgi:hypothetical protein
LIPLATAAQRALPVATLTAEGTLKAVRGQRLSLEHFSGAVPEGTAAWIGPASELVAIGERTGESFQVRRGFLLPTSASSG